MCARGLHHAVVRLPDRVAASGYSVGLQRRVAVSGRTPMCGSSGVNSCLVACHSPYATAVEQCRSVSIVPGEG